MRQLLKISLLGERQRLACVMRSEILGLFANELGFSWLDYTRVSVEPCV